MAPQRGETCREPERSLHRTGAQVRDLTGQAQVRDLTGLPRSHALEVQVEDLDREAGGYHRVEEVHPGPQSDTLEMQGPAAGQSVGAEAHERGVG